MKLRTPSFVVGCLYCFLGACSAGTTTAAAGPGDGGPPEVGDDSDSDLDLTPGPGEVDPNDTRDVPIRELECDESGETCVCLKLALLGSLDSLANQKDTQPFVDWLNANSGGTATVTMVPQKPTLDEDFLAQYDVLLVANVNTWSFSDAEKAAVAGWSATGGGIIALTGFTSDPTEPAATSQLVAFAGMGFGSTATADDGIRYTNDAGEDISWCMGWSGENMGDVQNTTPVTFTQQEGSLAKLTFALTRVGAFMGWEAIAPPGSVVVATDPGANVPMCVAMEVNAAGRILTFGDEWLMFANQWEPIGNPPSAVQDENNRCWVMPTAESEGYYLSAATLYQAKQFWYNAINWVAPPNECNFTIVDQDVEVY